VRACVTHYSRIYSTVSYYYSSSVGFQNDRPPLVPSFSDVSRPAVYCFVTPRTSPSIYSTTLSRARVFSIVFDGIGDLQAPGQLTILANPYETDRTESVVNWKLEWRRGGGTEVRFWFRFLQSFRFDGVACCLRSSWHVRHAFWNLSNDAPREPVSTFSH